MKSTQKKHKDITRQLFRWSEEETLTLDFVLAIAGDRTADDEERARFESLYSRYGAKLFAEMLFKITHQYYPPEQAETLWHEINRHKHQLSDALGRNAGMVMAALDYLANIKHVLLRPMIIRANEVSSIAEVAIKDSLTLLFDHATFVEKLEIEISRYQRYGSEVSVIMIDIDDFKHFNDTHGHQEGDHVLMALAKLMQKTSRTLDLCARYGGEEFVMILPQTGIDDAYFLAERLRQETVQHFLPTSGITISAGVATCPIHATTAKALIQQADRALYDSKNSGKNQVRRAA